jgi:transcriptional regulator with XRE-family HTH domain
MREASADFVGQVEMLVASTEPEALAPRIGERIACLRQRRGWSRVELAKRLAVQRDRLAKWELGKNLPPVEMLAPLARTLGVSADELLTGEPPAGAPLSAERWRELAFHVEALGRLLEETGLVD